jgi:hypothetical protein
VRDDGRLVRLLQLGGARLVAPLFELLGERLAGLHELLGRHAVELVERIHAARQ